MLIKMKALEGIRSGEITLAFRRWKRPTVREGGQLTTAIGVLAIDAMRVVTLTGISEAWFGTTTRWRQIYILNSKKIGRDPDDLRVGMTLKMPIGSRTASSG